MDIRNLIKNPKVSHGTVAVVAFAAGAGATYLWQRQVRQNLLGYILSNPEVVQEVAEEDEGQEATVMPIRDFGRIEQAKAQHPSIAQEEVEPDPEPEITSIFRPEDNGWDWEAELASRADNAPYVIHKDEYFGDEMGWDSQSTLTYYVGDDILADEHDKPIYNISEVVGEIKFGHGSGDPSVFYVRNPVLQAEYEVLRHTGRYDIEVLGSDVEDLYEKRDLKHMQTPGRMRRE